jgi:hypothetical protein
MTLLLERIEAIVACFLLYFYLLYFFSTVVKLFRARELLSAQWAVKNIFMDFIQTKTELLVQKIFFKAFLIFLIFLLGKVNFIENFVNVIAFFSFYRLMTT